MGPNPLREFFEDGSVLHAMVSDLERYYRGEREASRQSSVENSGPRVGGDRESTMGRKGRDPEGRPQASRQNSVVDSGPGGRGDRESTSPAPSPGDLTERNVDWDKLRFRAKRPEMYYPTLLGEFLAEDGAVCIPPGRYYWLECSSSSLSISTAGEATREDVFRLPFVADRVRDGRLDPELAATMWNYHVGYDFHAGEDTFYAFRHAVIRHDKSSETDEEDFLDSGGESFNGDDYADETASGSFDGGV